MHSGIVRLLLVGFAVSPLAGCSLPEAAAATGKGAVPTSSGDRQLTGEEREIERGRRRQQNEVLTDLQKLREELGGTTQLAKEDVTNAEQPKLLIFGGANHEVYLGCLCEGDNPESVFNLEGEYGSGRSPTSLRNKRAPYGSSYEDTSACFNRAKHPPSVVASDGKALGLLTTNASLKKRIATR